MARIGYARVSTREQKTDSQVDELRADGCERIYRDVCTGKLAERPELDMALAFLREGDIFVITRLSRAMRSVKHMIELAEDLKTRGVALRVLKQDIDTTTATGRMVFTFLAAIDEWQRELIVEGTLEGLAAARARGRSGGRPRKLSDRGVMRAQELVAARQLTMTEIARTVGCSRATLYRSLGQGD